MVETAGYVALVERDWSVPQGADTINAFRYGTIDGEDEEISYPMFVTDGWSARAQIRSTVGGEVWVDFLSTEVTGPRVELDDEGNVSVILPHDTTENEEWNSRVVGFYDLELTDPDSTVIRLAKGTVLVSPDITRV